VVAVHATLSYLQSIVMGFVQGLTELFPVSSLGHGVLVPGWLGWHNLVGSESANSSFFLAFLVGLHVGTALALLIFYRERWMQMAAGIGRQWRAHPNDRARSLVALKDPQMDGDYRLFLLLVLATIPVGLAGLVLEHRLRTLFVKPLDAAIFLTINGVILGLGELLRRHRRNAPTLERITPLTAIAVGATQILALFAGISRSGVTMVGGLLAGWDHEESADFAFLLATPVILLAGVLKLPDLLGAVGSGVRVQSLVGAVCAGVAAYVSVRFLVKWFKTKTLWPFAAYCAVAGIASILRFA
jgi:undecaprenyl-diphosphatase